MIAADPRAPALDTYDGRLGFRVLALVPVRTRYGTGRRTRKAVAS